MLTDKLRDGAHGKVFKILFWIIILSFIFAGVGNYLIPKLNTDPVKIIQDCSLRDLLCRCINCYFDDATLPNCNTNRRNFGLF